MEKAARKNLIAIAAAYGKARGWSLATVSKEVHGNSKFLAEFKAGKCSTTLAHFQTMLGKFWNLYRKAGLDWPEMSPIQMTPPPLNKRGDKSP